VILLAILLFWFGCGTISLILLKKEELPPIYKVLLFMEGLIGLLFIVFLKGGKNEK